MSEKGYVYVLLNPSLKYGLKIGKGERLPGAYSRELDDPNYPEPFEIYATLQTEKYIIVERLISKIVKKKEKFYDISPKTAYEILSDFKEILGDEAVINLNGDIVGVPEKVKNFFEEKKSNHFDFYSRGLKNGTVINFIGDESITAIVAGRKHVLFENYKWKLSPLARELYERMGIANDSGAYQGAAHFTYKGTKLIKLPIE